MVPKGRTGLKIRVMVNRVKEDEKSSELTEKKKKKKMPTKHLGILVRS